MNNHKHFIYKSNTHTKNCNAQNALSKSNIDWRKGTQANHLYTKKYWKLLIVTFIQISGWHDEGNIHKHWPPHTFWPWIEKRIFTELNFVYFFNLTIKYYCNNTNMQFGNTPFLFSFKYCVTLHEKDVVLFYQIKKTNICFCTHACINYESGCNKYDHYV